jgi:hypothetical protein
LRAAPCGRAIPLGSEKASEAARRARQGNERFSNQRVGVGSADCFCGAEKRLIIFFLQASQFMSSLLSRPSLFDHAAITRSDFRFAGVRVADKLALTMTDGKTSPISAAYVGRAVAAILDDPAPHIGQIYDLTGPGIRRSEPLRVRFFRGARLAHPISRRPAPGVERRLPAGGISRAPRQPPHGHDRVEQTWALRPHDGHHAHARSPAKHRRTCAIS